MGCLSWWQFSQTLSKALMENADDIFSSIKVFLMDGTEKNILTEDEVEQV